MARGAVETATEGTEAVVVVVEVEEVSGTWMNMGLVSLPAWSFHACLVGAVSGVAGWAGTGMALLGLGCAAAGWSGRAHISHVVWGPRAAEDLYCTLRGRGEGPDGLLWLS